ncbi:MAG TPA: succinate dehydrogenase assembly factor 2 [Gammaproteobacteria bacterium]|nr:succinate dehydrogenase assembly factor 2 [Gammaproteobacteria bacterium]
MRRTDLERLRWRCRRGMRELDAVLQSFLEAEFASLADGEMACFERILDLPDPELLGYVSGRSVPADADIASLVDRIRRSHRPRA